MENTKEMLSFRVLGQEINFRAQQEDDQVSPQEVVELVNKEAEELLKKLPHLAMDQVSVLVALKLAQDLLGSEAKTKHELNKIRSSAVDALRFIEEVSPSLN